MDFELDTLIENAEIVKFIKAQRTRSLGHIFRMNGKRNAENITEWKYRNQIQEKTMEKMHDMCGEKLEDDGS